MRPAEPCAGWRVSIATTLASRSGEASRRRAFTLGAPQRHARHATSYRDATRIGAEVDLAEPLAGSA
ncbi:hypothetical protein [Burkholderia gladioli]|uniref:hypothetical protein n=1 Tax=Burkholderia gladioli TaxID=28095 RepID=UPI00062725BA|nr:hypothetical protein [Burkholderia gladioli]KKJ02252.1 hypothetical protein XF14_34620 [Burkholderia gladioli]MBA1365637.1 hypothetical protein [Burkholderia gladioli]MBU9271500.1 hypothetical protein [Burkholderia gladioli]POS08249.1 hypothetical protein C3Y08_08965 [Burkholderia gladioli]PRE27784.1 hypothetical protein C6P72_07345 [Burkholderia gladioli]